MNGEKRFIDPMDAPDVKNTRWYQEKNLDATVEDIGDEDLDIEAIAARNETPNLKAMMAADIDAENRAENKAEHEQRMREKAEQKLEAPVATAEKALTEIEISPEAPKSAEVIVAKAEASLLNRVSSGMRDVFGAAASAYESLKNVGTIDNGEGKRIETGARASVTDMKRGVADFFADMRTTLFGGTEKQTIEVLQQDEATEGWEEKESEVSTKYPGLLGELISRLPDAPSTMKRAFLSVAVDVPKGIYESWKRNKELNTSLETIMKEEYGDHFDMATWKERQGQDMAEFSPEAIRARREAQDDLFMEGVIEAPGFMDSLRQEVVTVVGAGSEVMKSMHIAVGRAAKHAFYEEPLDLIRDYGIIASSLASDVKRGSEAAKGKGKEMAEGAVKTAESLKLGAKNLQTKAETAFGTFKEQTWGAKAKRDAATRAATAERLIDYGGVTKMTSTDRDRLLAGRMFSLEKQISEIKTAVDQGESHKKRLLLAFERVQKNTEARETVLQDIKRAIASESVDVAKNKNRMRDLQHLLNAYAEKATPVAALPETEIDAADEITEEMPRSKEASS